MGRVPPASVPLGTAALPARLLSTSRRLDGRLLFVLAASALFLAPLRLPYLFAGADSLHHTYRLVEFDRVLRDGVLLPRWAPDLYYGYGYPLFNYYAPLIYYLGELFHLLGADFVLATKLQVALGALLAAAAMYLLARRLVGPWPAAFAALVYIYAPYHLFDVYLAGELAQAFAWAWPPLALWGLLGVWECVRAGVRGCGSMGVRQYGGKTGTSSLPYLYTSVRPHLLAVSLAIAGLLFTHTLSAFLAAGFLAAAAAWLALGLTRRPAGAARFLAWTLGASLLGALLAASFWLPALTERGEVQVERAHETPYYDFHHNFPSVGTLFSRDWRFDWSSPPQDPNGYARAGLTQTLLGLAGAAVGVWRCGGVGVGGWRRTRGHEGPGPTVHGPLSTVHFFALAAAGLVYLMLPASAPLWERLPLGSFVQFPTRLLMLYSLCCAVLAGVALQGLLDGLESVRPGLAAGAVRAGLAVFASAAVVLSAWSDFQPRYVALPSPLALADLTRFELLSGHLGTSTRAEFLPVAVKAPAASSPMVVHNMLGPVPPPAGPVLGKAQRLDPPDAGEARLVEHRSTLDRVALRISKSATLTIATPAFPGWTAYVDGRPAPVRTESGSGLMVVDLPSGAASLELRFGSTPLRMAGVALAVVGWLLALTGMGVWAYGRMGVEGSSPVPPHSHTPTLPHARSLVPCLLPAALFFWPSPVPQTRGQRPLDLAFADGPVLAGYDLGPVADGALPVTLHFGAESPSPSGRGRGEGLPDASEAAASYPAELSLTNAAGQTWARAAGEARDGVLWNLPLPPGTPPNVYELRLRVQSPKSKVPSPKLVGDAGNFGPETLDFGLPVARLTYFLPLVNEARLGPVDVRLGQSSSDPHGPARPLAADFDGKLALLGADAWPASAIQGGPLTIGLYWQARAASLPDYTISLRLVDSAGETWGQRDDQPAGGQYPTSGWTPGSLVHDVRTLYVDPATPPGRYFLDARMYVPGAAPLLVLPTSAEGQAARIGPVAVAPAARPDAGALRVGQRLDARFGDELRLLGYDLLTPQASPGGTASLTLYWQALKSGGPYRLHLEAGSAATLDVPLASAVHPLAHWDAGEISASRLKLSLAADAPAGPAPISLRMSAPSGELPPSGAGSGDTSFWLPRPLSVLDLGRRFEVPAMQLRLGLRLGDLAELLGYDLRKENNPRRVELTLYWRALGSTPTGYKVFTHLIGPGGGIVAQQDVEPVNSSRPTTGWQLNEILTDRYELALPPGAPPGPYGLALGMYSPESGARLPVRDALGRSLGDHVELPGLNW